MMIRGVLVSKRNKRKAIEKLVRRIFPRASVWVSHYTVKNECRIRWTGYPAYEDMRALADDVEAAMPARTPFTIVCLREETLPPWPAWGLNSTPQG